MQVIDWVLGPGERYLSTSKDIGDSVISCEILRKEHEEFEMNARVRKPYYIFCQNIISCIMHAFSLVLTYDLLEDKRTDDVIVEDFFPLFFFFFLMAEKFEIVEDILPEWANEDVLPRLWTNSKSTKKKKTRFLVENDLNKILEQF